VAPCTLQMVCAEGLTNAGPGYGVRWCLHQEAPVVAEALRTCGQPCCDHSHPWQQWHVWQFSLAGGARTLQCMRSRLWLMTVLLGSSGVAPHVGLAAAGMGPARPWLRWCVRSTPTPRLLYGSGQWRGGWGEPPCGVACLCARGHVHGRVVAGCMLLLSNAVLHTCEQYC
jgi:hypothetical protein